VVTGGGSGIGRGTALLLARQGCDVAIVDRDENGARDAVEELRREGLTAISSTADVGDEAAVAAALAEVRDQLGDVDILVNNAGIARDDDLVDMSTSDWDDVVATHLRGAFLLCRGVVPAMRAQGWGRIVNISSISALAHAGRANYIAAKAGLEAFTKALAHETAADGVTVNAVGPGVVVTGMTALGAERQGITLEERVEAMRRTIPVGRVGTPYDIARAVAFFTDEEADYVTGQVIYVSGGPDG
jgi:3-oxoacyl-[acyl-carrier protein] reductase